MIKHVVLFRRRPGVTSESKDYIDGLSALRGLGEVIDDVRELSMVESVGGEGMWDVVSIALFDDMEALGRYLAHPAHLAAAELFGKAAEYAYADVPA